jgi:hypothetical protein
MTSADWVTVLLAAIAAISAMFATWVGARANRRLNTNGGKTIGQHVEELNARMDALMPPPEAPTGAPRPPIQMRWPDPPWKQPPPEDPSTGQK